MRVESAATRVAAALAAERAAPADAEGPGRSDAAEDPGEGAAWGPLGFGLDVAGAVLTTRGVEGVGSVVIC